MGCVGGGPSAGGGSPTGSGGVSAGLVDDVHDAAVEYVDHAVGVGGDGGVVGDHDQRVVVALDHGLDQGEDLFAGAAVQVPRRLVGKDDVGVGYQGAGDAHALLLAAAHLRGLVVQVLLQPEVAEHLARGGAALAGADAAVDQGHGHVLQRGHGGEEVELLEDEADVPKAKIHQLLFVHLLQVLPRDHDAAAGGLFQPRHHVQQRGLAAARAADDADELPRVNIQVDPVQRPHPLFAHAVGLL